MAGMYGYGSSYDSGAPTRARLESEKLVTTRRLLEAVDIHRQLRQRILLAVAAFESLDERVIGMLETASRSTDIVIAGICVAGEPDANHAVFNADDRARMLATSPWVDYVIHIESRELRRFVCHLRPDLVITLDSRLKPLIENYGNEVRLYEDRSRD